MTRSAPDDAICLVIVGHVSPITIGRYPQASINPQWSSGYDFRLSCVGSSTEPHVTSAGDQGSIPCWGAPCSINSCLPALAHQCLLPFAIFRSFKQESLVFWTRLSFWNSVGLSMLDETDWRAVNLVLCLGDVFRLSVCCLALRSQADKSISDWKMASLVRTCLGRRKGKARLI